MLNRYRKAIQEALEIVTSRNSRNAIVPLEDMFPHGLQDLTFMLYMKASRALGEEQEGDLVKVRDEALDIINYAGFLIAMIDEMKEEADEPSIPQLVQEMRDRQIALDEIDCGGKPHVV